MVNCKRADRSRANVAKVRSELVGIRDEQSRANVAKVRNKRVGRQ